MASNTNIPVSPPTFPPGYCFPATAQQLLNDASTYGMSVPFPAQLTGTILSTTTPSASARNLVWFKLNANDNSLLGTFTYSPVYNLWIQPHRVPSIPVGSPANTGERRIYLDTLTNLLSYDGGDGTANGNVTDTTGPIWEQDTNWSNGSTIGYMPFGIPGTSPSSITTPGQKALWGIPGGSTTGLIGCYFIMRTARIYLTG